MSAAASDHVIVVLGHRSRVNFGVHIISDQCIRRVRHAEQLADQADVRAVILSGWGAAGDSEARQMARVWGGGSVPLILEEQSTNTAENATRCLDLIQAMPGVRRVTVVTSGWHVRSPYFFRHYREHGIDVRFHFAPVDRQEWPRYLIHEFKAMPKMRRMARQAWRQAGHDRCPPRDGEMAA